MAIRSLFVIDSRIKNYLSIVAAIPDGAEWILLDAESDGLDQIATQLAINPGYAELHVFAYGSDGQLALGGSVLDSAALVGSTSTLQSIGASLLPDADILFYGSNLAATSTGQAFIQQFADLTGADVAASTDATGGAAVGGNWTLEAAVGTVEAQPLSVAGFEALLGSVSGTADDDVIMAVAGNDSIDGAEGQDTVIYAGNFADYQITGLATGFVVEGAEGRDVLTNVERLSFADTSVDLINKGAAEERVNTVTAGSQEKPAITMLKDGGWVVTWQGQGESGFEIYQKRFTATGDLLQSDMQVNTYTSGEQNNPVVTALADGGWVVIWESLGQDGSEWGIYGQRYGSNGAAIGGELKINTTTTSNQRMPDVTALLDGGWVVTWHSWNQDAWDVYGQCFASDGSAAGAEFRVNSYTSSHQYSPSITMLADGSWIIAWKSNNAISGGWGTYAQHYTADGVKIGDEFLIGQIGNDIGESPAIAALPDGGWIIFWASWGGDGSGWALSGKRFASDGSQVGDALVVNTYTPSDQVSPSVVVLQDGGWVVTWMSWAQDGSAYGIYGQRFNADGTALGNEFRINSVTQGYQMYPALTALDDGGWLVTWQSDNQDGSGGGIYSQRYAASGDPYNGIVLVRAATTGDDIYQIVNATDSFAETSDGGFDTVNSSISWTMSDNIEKLILTGNDAISGIGNNGDNEIIGNAGSNGIFGGGGDDILTGGAGDDFIDGGSGYNTLVLSGSRADYRIPAIADRSADGFVVLLRGDSKATDGSDTIRNIQKIIFAGETNPANATVILDDYSNAPDAGNQVITYGKVYSGSVNFKGDLDYFLLNATAGQSITIDFQHPQGYANTYINIGNEFSSPNRYYESGYISSTTTLTKDGLVDVFVNTFNQNDSYPSQYNFVIRRKWTGTDNADEMVGDGRYESLAGGAGNDTLTGGQYSDVIDGGSGNDLLRGDGGDDRLDGGSGANTAVYSGNRADYSIAFLGNATWSVTHLGGGADGTDTVSNIQQLQFADQTLVLDDLTNSWDSAAVASYSFGDRITGKADFASDSDWFKFDFGDYDNQAFSIRLDTANVSGRFRVVNEYGDVLHFRDAQGNDVTLIGGGQTYTLTPVGWGNNPADDPFFGGIARIEFVSTIGSDGSYSISISRLLLGTEFTDSISAVDGQGNVYEALRGLGGNDTLTGSVAAEQLFGDDGNDTLIGGAGDDFLQGGAGTNLVQGGDGNDIIDVSGRASVLDTIDGGAGTDTLQISQGVSLSGAQISNVEVITSTNGGNFAFTTSALAAWGIQRLENLTVSLAAPGTFDGSALSGDYQVLGSTGNDVIRTGSGNNTINARAGVADVSAGAGDDRVLYEPASADWQGSDVTKANYLSGDSQTRTYTLQGRIDGGAGNDVLEFAFPYWWVHSWGGDQVRNGSAYTIDLSKAQLTGLEILRVTGNGGGNNLPATFTMTAAQMSAFTKFENVRGVNLVGGGTVDLAAFSAKGGVNLTFGDAAGYTLIGSASRDVLTDTAGADIIQTGEGADLVTLTSGSDQVSLGVGDDTVIISGKSTVTDRIDGGEGVDTLIVEGDLVDLSQADITGIEKIEVSARSLSMSEAQWTQFAGKVSVTPGTSVSFGITMTEAGVKTLAEGAAFSDVTGTGGDDQISGNSGANILSGGAGADILSGALGNDRLAGGAGDDRLEGGADDDLIDGGDGRDTAVFEHGFASYRLTPTTTGLIVEGPEGTDFLTNVERLQFADVAVDVTLLGAAETRVNTYTSNAQSESTIVKLADGGWVVVWQSLDQDGSSWGIYGQMYSADGKAKGSEFRISERIISEQMLPSMVALTDGGFAVVFQEYGPNGVGSQASSWNIRGQTFNADGQPMGSQFFVTSGASSEVAPVISQLRNGDLIVAWEAEDGNVTGIFAQRLGNDGTLKGAAFLVNTNTLGYQVTPVVTALDDGGWLVSWRHDNSARIVAQRYDANGVAIGSEFQLGANVDSRLVSIETLPDGGWIVVQNGAWDPSGLGIFSTRYDANGEVVGNASLVNTSVDGDQTQPDVAVLADGGWIVVWTSISNSQNDSGVGVYAQRFDSLGNKLGNEFRVNTYINSDQSDPSVTALTDGGWVISWTSAGQDGSSNGIYSQRYTASGQPYANFALDFVGLASNDQLIGDETNNTFAGGDGNDQLSGLGGNDLLITGAGTDALLGGAGDDRLMVTGKLQVRDALDGGEGTDTLLVSDGMDLSGAVIERIEILKGSGTIMLRPEQLNGLQIIDGLTVQLTGSAQSLTLPAGLTLVGGARILMPAADLLNVPDGSGLLGSKNDDALVGSANNDVIFGGRGADTISGGAGNDTIYGGSGADILSGGEGNDRFIIYANEHSVWGQSFYSDRIDGGLGSDTLDISFGNDQQTLTIENGALASIETLVLRHNGRANVFMSADQWQAFSSVTATGAININFTGDSETLSFANLNPAGGFSEIYIDGAHGLIDATTVTVNIQRLLQFDQIKLGAGNDLVRIYDGLFSANLGGGNDQLIFHGDRLSATIDGGGGDDVLDLSVNSYVDLSAAVLAGIETVRHGNGTVLVTQSQLGVLSFEGAGKIFLKNGNNITGTAGDDQFNGTGVESFNGGKGNDVVSNVNTFVLSGNQADYNFVRNGAQLTIEHARGSMADGTDTLTGVMNLQFADSAVSFRLDDAPDNLSLFLGANDRSLLTDAQYDKRISAEKDYAADVDIFKATLVPNSPLVIEASSASSNGGQFIFIDAATGQQIYFKSMVHGWIYDRYFIGWDASLKMLPGLMTQNGFQPYAGGDVVIQANIESDPNVNNGVTNYAFTLKYLDDYAGSTATTATLNPQASIIRGYVGDISDQDWIGTELIAGTEYAFTLSGLSSGGGTLVDPQLRLMDSEGRLIATGANSTGLDDTIVFRAATSGTYFLNVSDIAGVAKGSWTLTQKSLDTIAGNVSSTERINWGSSNRFTVSSEINVLTDHDWFRVWLDKGMTYSFRQLGTAGGGGTLADPLLMLRSATGVLVALGSNDGDASSSRITFSAPDSGWYFLDAGAMGNAGKGTYTLTGSTLVDDFAGALTTTGVVDASGTPVSGLISFNGDSDWFRVGLSKGQTYVIDLVGDIADGAQLDPLTDPLLIIRDQTGAIVAQIDDFSGSLNPRAYFTPANDGLYFLEAKSAFRFSVGAYQLRVGLTPQDDFGGTLGTAGTLALGSAKPGEIGMPGDRDMFSIQLEAGKVYQVGVAGMSGNAGSLADPHLRIFDGNGRLVEFDANGGAGNDAGLYFAPTVSGTYYIEASAGDDHGMGTYSVQVVQRDVPSDDYAGNLSTTGLIQPGQAISGNLLTKNDQDWFKVTLDGGKDYVFRLKGATSGSGTLSDPLLEIRDANGALLQIIDNTLLANEPGVLFTPIASGTFYLVARAADGNVDTGTYELVVRAPDDHGNTRATATSIQLGQTLDGGIQWSDGAFGVRAMDSIGLATDSDEDWFRFTAEQGQALSFSVQIADSMLSRPMVEIVDEFGRTVALADGLEAANGLASATFRAAEAGTFYARIIDGAGATGAYVATLAAGDVSDEDTAGPVELSFSGNGPVTSAVADAKIGLAGDTDSFTVSLQAGHSYRIEAVPLRNGSSGPVASARLSLDWQATGSEQTENVEIVRDYGTASFFDSTQFTAQSTGTLSIQISTDDPLQTGQYRLRVIDLGPSTVDIRPDTVAGFDPVRDGVLAMNDNVAGKVDSLDDTDLYAIDLTAGNLYDFAIKGFGDGVGTLAQGSLKLLDANGQLVSSGRYDAETGRTELAVSVFDTGRYYLSVSAVQLTGNTGTFVLETRLRDASTLPADDIAGDSRSGVSAAPGQTASGRIDYAGDSDWVRITMEGGKVYVIDVLADGDGAGGTLTNASARLLDANGNEVAFDDNSGAGLDSRLQFTPPGDGTYYLDVSGADGATGTYTVRVRELYSGIADPLRSAQWYLAEMGLDQVSGNISGAGVTIGMIDDGIDTTHPDLQYQIDYRNSYDTVGDVADGKNKIPYPTVPWGDFHGTAVAGLMVAQENNEAGIVGVAPDAQVASIRVKWTWEQITEALSLQYQFDISNNSWGAIAPFSDNFNSTSLTFAYEALRKGVEDGRDGLGTVFVFSAGNSATYGMNTNYFNFQNAREVITVGALNGDGSAAGFSTPGASVLVGAFGVGLLTTDRREPGLGLNTSGNYTSFSGTSAAAPLVSGVIALMLEANPTLGYRDVQQILAYSSTHPDTQTWKTNGASNWNLGGLRFNDASGFGMVNAASAVALAQTWTESDTSVNETMVSKRAFGMNATIPDAGVYTKTFTIDSSLNVEHIELGIDLRHTRLGDLIIEITSPSGTVSRLMDRPTVNAEQPYGISGDDSGVPTHLLWDFSSVQFWGEDAAGEWTITIRDVRAEEVGSIASLSLRIYGEADDGNDVYVFTDEGFAQASSQTLADESGTDTINGAPVRHDMLVDLVGGIIAANGVSHRIESWSVIENVTTGSGNDSLVGNNVANVLNGFNGNDVLKGGGGNDILIGGAGSDVARYAGNIAEFTLSWNPDTKVLTIIDNKLSDGDEGTDQLTGIERIVFADGEINLASQMGNAAPVANKSFFASPVLLSKGIGLDYALPDTAFTDDDAEAGSLSYTITSASGSELPEWMSYDPATGKITGVPPADLQGQIQLLITATDSFGQSTTETLTLQFGDNQAPQLETPREIVILEDASLLPLAIAVPVDPEGKTVTITILEIPTTGTVLDKLGNPVQVGTVLDAEALQELHYQAAADIYGAAGMLRYEAKDEDGVTAQSSIRIFIDPVNDAPRFATESSKLVIQYPEQSQFALDLARPVDPESTLSSVRVIELPSLGKVTLDGQNVTINQILTFDQMARVQFSLAENVNGPIGSLTIQAVDPQGAATNWSLAFEVQGESGSSEGTAANDDLYGSIGSDVLYGYGGNDTLVGNAGNDRLLGGLGDDRLFGGSGNDQLDGSSGNDYLDGGPGGDTMSGGPGNDTYLVDSASDVVLEVVSAGAGGKDTVATSISYTAPANVENLIALAGAAIDLTGNALDNGLSGNELDNRLSGGAGRDVLLGYAGNDVLNGGTDIDRMVGGQGNDTYFVDSRFEEVAELANEGYDVVYAASSFTLSANVEKLVLQEGGDWTAGGNSLDNVLIGNAGNNVLSGGLGRDRLEGGLGNDIYVLSDALDTIIDTGGIDTIRSSLDVLLQADIENGELTGIFDLSLTGNSQANVLSGNAGNNIIDGQGGVDTLSGGAGSDQFIISSNGAGVATDIITDFNPDEDLLVLDLASFGFDLQGLGVESSGLVISGSFLKGAGVVALDPDDHFLFDTAQNKLFFDPDGNGAEQAVELVRFSPGTDGQSDVSKIDVSNIFVVL